MFLLASVQFSVKVISSIRRKHSFSLARHQVAMSPATQNGVFPRCLAAHRKGDRQTGRPQHESLWHLFVMATRIGLARDGHLIARLHWSSSSLLLVHNTCGGAKYTPTADYPSRRPSLIMLDCGRIKGHRIHLNTRHEALSLSLSR